MKGGKIRILMHSGLSRERPWSTAKQTGASGMFFITSTLTFCGIKAEVS